MATKALSAAAPQLHTKLLNWVTIVTGLGYLVDGYDMWLFNVVRVQSLTDIGLSGNVITQAGIHMLNLQMLGIILGGFFWGYLADKIGRKNALLGSILVYSLATLGNAFVTTVGQYELCRFIAGIGLVGEVGVGVTLVVESMKAERRGLGVMTFWGLGLLGIVATAIATAFLHWRLCYFIGGMAGLALLFLRSVVMDSAAYKRMAAQAPEGRGNVLAVLRHPQWRLWFLQLVLIGVPQFFCLNILMTLAPELLTYAGSTFRPGMGLVLAIVIIGTFVGGIGATWLGQYLHSRRKVIIGFLWSMLAVIGFYLVGSTQHEMLFLAGLALIGLAVGYWIQLITMAAELFPTKIRGTTATTIPAFIRASTIPMNLALLAMQPVLGLWGAAVALGALVMLLALWAAHSLPESFNVNLDTIQIKKRPRKSGAGLVRQAGA